MTVEKYGGGSPTAEWAAAFVAAYGEMPTIPRDEEANTGKYSYKYAALATIIGKVRTVLKEHKLAAVQAISSDAHSISVETRIYHEGGHVESFGPLMMPSGASPQQAGSAITYARRYALCAALGIAPDDDDDAKSVAGEASASQQTAPRESGTSSPPPGAVATPGKQSAGLVTPSAKGGDDGTSPVPAAAPSDGLEILKRHDWATVKKVAREVALQHPGTPVPMKQTQLADLPGEVLVEINERLSQGTLQ